MLNGEIIQVSKMIARRNGDEGDAMTDSKGGWKPLAFKYQITGMLTANFILCVIEVLVSLAVLKLMDTPFSVERVALFLVLANGVSAFPQVFSERYFQRAEHTNNPVSWANPIVHTVLFVIIMLLISLFYPVGTVAVPACLIVVDLAVALWSKPKDSAEEDRIQREASERFNREWDEELEEKTKKAQAKNQEKLDKYNREHGIDKLHDKH